LTIAGASQTVVTPRPLDLVNDVGRFEHTWMIVVAPAAMSEWS